ncbi:uncharacterized protein LOC143342729 isoform X1 [Colletes latitarsis]|uniref:uncharacterized protein LOC143342729 isoform X1 n=1 Tax=Colletes latitarsis TaxID=2605962 RepID=UPI0040352A55
MISQTSEELITAAPPGAEKRPKQVSKPRKLSTRTFDFLWRRNSRRKCASENEEKEDDFVEVRIVECNVNNVLPSKTSFSFFKNIKKHMQVKKLTICKSKRKENKIQVSSLENSTNHDSSILQNDRPTISTEKANESEFKCENTVETFYCLSNNDISTASEESFQTEEVLENLNETLENVTEGTERKLDTVNNRAFDKFGADNDCNDIPSTYQSYSVSNGQELECNTAIENIAIENQIENIHRNTETNEMLSNDNKVKASLTEELLKLSNYGWYWGPISGNEADAKLLSEPDGAFLVRDSSDDRYVLTLSFKSSGMLLHARMEHSGGLFSLCNQSESEGFSSVADLIDHSMNFSQSAVFCYSRPRFPGQPSFPVRLTKPVSRFTQVRSLQYLCRFVIRQNTRLDNIHKLPLPKTIKGYIEEAHY